MKPVETACKTHLLCVLYAQGQTFFSLQTAFATPDNCAPFVARTYNALARIM